MKFEMAVDISVATNDFCRKVSIVVDLISKSLPKSSMEVITLLRLDSDESSNSYTNCSSMTMLSSFWDWFLLSLCKQACIKFLWNYTPFLCVGLPYNGVDCWGSFKILNKCLMKILSY